MANSIRYNHDENLSKIDSVQYSSLEPGDVIKFDYDKNGSDVEEKLVLVVDTETDDKLHGLDLSYLREQEIVKLHQLSASKLLRESERESFFNNLPRLVLNIDNPRRFYESVINQIYFSQSAYRTYKIGNILPSLIERFTFVTELEDELNEQSS